MTSSPARVKQTQSDWCDGPVEEKNVQTLTGEFFQRGNLLFHQILV